MVTFSTGVYVRFNGTTETSEEEVKELIIFDGNYIQVFLREGPDGHRLEQPTATAFKFAWRKAW